MSKAEAFFIVGDEAAAEVNVGDAMIARINEMAEILVGTVMLGATKEETLEIERRHGSPIGTKPFGYYKITIERCIDG